MQQIGNKVYFALSDVVRSAAEMATMTAYAKIQAAHQAAYTNYPGKEIVYPDPPSSPFQLEIPSSSVGSIKLYDGVDFNGWTFLVNNMVKDNHFLFKMVPFSSSSAYDDNIAATTSISLSASSLAKNAIISQLPNNNPRLLRVKDDTLWTQRKKGPDTFENVHRKDLLFINNKTVVNDPITSYDPVQSSPSCKYIDVDTAPKTIKNITLIRTSTSSSVTNLLFIQYKYNVRIENVTIETPTGTTLYFDSCIRVWDSAKILMEKIKIHNTYCASNQYGYGIEMDNVWDSHFEHLEAYQTERGVFATNNTNEFYISNSELNRVDIHCYGKNVTCVNCDFRKGNNNDQFYNRFSSFYGTLTYRNCRFHDFIPVRLDSEYDSFAPYDVVMENCVLNVTTTVAHVCNIPIIHNNRWQGVSNLVPRSLPRLYITNLRVNVSQNVQYFLLFYIGQVENNADRNFDYLNELNVDVSIFGENPSNPLNIWGSNYQIYVNGTLNTEFYVSRPTQTTVLYITSNIS